METKDDIIHRLQKRLQAVELTYNHLHENFSSCVREEVRKSVSNYKRHVTEREKYIKLLEKKLNAINKACKIYNNVGIVEEQNGRDD